ncbi:MAG TPA: winged helix-turn-helix domain-containing protein, partial [Actinomycetota bacterium]|nr:winged helix-turn-helix domain-containing protein [Actinomycetota bacterium]
MKRRERRAATPEEARALANPLRLRILRLSLDQALTNKQLAERLGMDPGTVLHHVRTLVRTGFLAAEAVRQGERGALEKPYRATGKS